MNQENYITKILSPKHLLEIYVKVSIVLVCQSSSQFRRIVMIISIKTKRKFRVNNLQIHRFRERKINIINSRNNSKICLISGVNNSKKRIRKNK